jgi:hypothetical protein
MTEKETFGMTKRETFEITKRATFELKIFVSFRETLAIMNLKDLEKSIVRY